MARRVLFHLSCNRHFMTEGSPILRIERLTFTAERQPLDFEYLYHRGDAFQYRLRVERNATSRAGT